MLLFGLYAILGGLISAVLIILKLSKEEINKKVYQKITLIYGTIAVIACCGFNDIPDKNSVPEKSAQKGIG